MPLAPAPVSRLRKCLVPGCTVWTPKPGLLCTRHITQLPDDVQSRYLFGYLLHPASPRTAATAAEVASLALTLQPLGTLPA